MGIIKKGCVANPNASAPNPYVFVIEGMLEMKAATLVMVRYPGCTNLEGRKLLLFLGRVGDQIRRATKLDPHFSEERLSPTARFRPDQNGLDLAIWMAESIESAEEKNSPTH
jgi:hypothetical protein